MTLPRPSVVPPRCEWCGSPLPKDEARRYGSDIVCATCWWEAVAEEAERERELRQEARP